MCSGRSVSSQILNDRLGSIEETAEPFFRERKDNRLAGDRNKKSEIKSGENFTGSRLFSASKEGERKPVGFCNGTPDLLFSRRNKENTSDGGWLHRPPPPNKESPVRSNNGALRQPTARQEKKNAAVSTLRVIWEIEVESDSLEYSLCPTYKHELEPKIYKNVSTFIKNTPSRKENERNRYAN